MYALSAGTSFIPNGKVGIGFHEMWIVSGLLIGNQPYAEYFSTPQELKVLKN